MNFTALTISMRHQLIPWVGSSISRAVVPPDVDLRWTVKLNPPIKLSWSKHIELWDQELQRLSGTWVLLLSDDNAMHPDLLHRWRTVLQHSPGVKALHVRQQFGPQSFRSAGLDHLCGGRCDGGQVIFDADYFNSFGWSYARHQWEGDLFREMHDRNPSAFAFLDETLAYHDRINW